MNRKQIVTATLALFVLALCAFGQTADTKPPTSAPTYDPISVERGKTLFVGTCGFCHGATAKGGEKGPDLLRSVLVLDDEHGANIGPVVLKGRPEKGMPRFSFSQQQILDIANFLHSSIESAAHREGYKILNIVTGDVTAGKAYFNGAGKCSACHSVQGDLKGIASRYEPVTLQGKILQPDYSWTEGTPPREVFAVSITVTLPSGESFTGRPQHLDDFNVSLREANGTFRSFQRTNDGPRVELHNRLQGHLDLLNVYTDSDIHNLTAYLVTLK